MPETTKRALATAWLLVAAIALPAAEPPAMKFNEVRQVAPGVFFRYSSISATDKTVAFGGSNNVWVVFEDFVLVYDANFPREAGDVIAAVRRTTDKPIRYVVDSHHHGDHAYGNAVFAAAGATVVAHANCARLLRESGPKEFAEAGRGPAGRKDVRDSSLKAPSLVFDDKLVFDDGKQRAEVLFLGHAHTLGDALLYLPRHRVLCTGDSCVNGAYNFMGHSDSASWVRVLERAEQLDVKTVCPGHGPLAGKELLEKQKRYFVELRRLVREGVEAGKGVDELVKAIDLPWYKEWTGVPPAGDNVKHVYHELTGQTLAWELIEDFGLREGPSPAKDTPGWTKPRRIVVPQLMPARLAELKRVAPEVEFVPVKTAEEAAREAADADAVIGFVSAEVVRAGTRLRWVQALGAAHAPAPELSARKVALTDARDVEGPTVADQAFGLLLALTRRLGGAEKTTPDSLPELHGKTMLVVGLRGAGMPIARRAQAFGMRVLAVDAGVSERPGFVFRLEEPARLAELLPRADVVVLAGPPSGKGRGSFGEAQLKAMKPTAYLVNVSRGGLVQTKALVEALKRGHLAGAGLVDREASREPDHPLRRLPNVVLGPGHTGRSPEAAERVWRLWRENVRRFAAGERLLGVVEPTSAE